MISSLLVASRIGTALSHRTWVIEPAARCHLFLLLSGRALLTWPEQSPKQPDLEIAAPAMLWLPHPVRGTLQIMAGSDGFGASVAHDVLQRRIGDAALTVHLRPLLDRVVLAGPEALRPDLSLLSGSFAALVEESRETRPAATAMMGLHMALLLLLLWRCAGLHQVAGSRGADATTAQRFRQLVELHYREGLCIGDFASKLGVTRARLHDACLRATGRTPLALLHDRVLAEARTRLEQTDLPVEQVGYGIGFHDPGYFNRFFKRLTGQSPGAYRRSAAARPAPAAPSFAAWP
jgi:AraC family transcriptional activator of pobA